MFLVYENPDYFYIISCINSCDRIISLRRSNKIPGNLQEILKVEKDIAILSIVKSSKLVFEAPLLLGFIRFLNFYYIVLGTKREQCGSIQSKHIYTITGSHLLPIHPVNKISDGVLHCLCAPFNRGLSQSSNDSVEKRYQSLFQVTDLTKDFYFSYSYDVTRTLQRNYFAPFEDNSHEEAFVWNHHLLSEFEALLPLEDRQYWIVPVIHGYFEQKQFTSFGRNIDVILIARRSRHFAGTRYLKRGVNHAGHVANDCEIEIILQRDAALTYPSARPSLASYTQMRGSVPVFWSQETSVTVPQPPILLHSTDPAYRATKLHFQDLYRRYGRPVLVLDLVKQLERRRRESIIGRELFNAIEVLNAQLPSDLQLHYCGLDFSRISTDAKETLQEPMERYFAEVGVVSDAFDISSKGLEDHTARKEESDKPPGGASPRRSVDCNILDELDVISQYSLSETSFFTTELKHLRDVGFIQQNALRDAYGRKALIQRGVLRTNCVDCLDRTK